MAIRVRALYLRGAVVQFRKPFRTIQGACDSMEVMGKILDEKHDRDITLQVIQTNTGYVHAEYRSYKY